MGRQSRTFLFAFSTVVRLFPERALSACTENKAAVNLFEYVSRDKNYGYAWRKTVSAPFLLRTQLADGCADANMPSRCKTLYKQVSSPPELFLSNRNA